MAPDKCKGGPMPTKENVANVLGEQRYVARLPLVFTVHNEHRVELLTLLQQCTRPLTHRSLKIE